MSEQAAPEVRIFYADTKFERKARSAGGVSREQALQNAQAEVGNLKADFSVWIDREVDQLIADLAVLARRPADGAALERARIACEQLRDVGSTMGYQLVTFISATLHSILEALIEGAMYDQEVIDLHIAALRLALTTGYRNLSPDQVPEMANGLSRISALTTLVPRRGE